MRITRVRSFASTLLAVLMLGVMSPMIASAESTSTVSFAFWGDPAEEAAYEEVVASYEAQHPGIDIEMQYTPGKDDYRKRLGTAFSGGEPPNVFLINYREYGQYASSGALTSLDPYLQQSTEIAEADFYELPLDAFRDPAGELVCIPQNISSLVVYYNVDLFKAAGLPLPSEGWTLEDFVTAARALTQDTDGDGNTDVYGLVTESSLVRYAPFIWGAGGSLVDNPDQPTQLTLDTPEAKAGLDWFLDLGVREHGVVPPEAEVLAEDDLSRFMNGRAGMFFQSRRVVPTLREIDGFQWDVAPLPQGNHAAGVLHSDAFCMSAATETPEAAWDFIEYAAGPAGQEILARTGRTVPSLKAVAESPVFLGDEGAAIVPAHSRVFLDTIPALQRLPSISTWPEIEDIFNAEFQTALYEEHFDLDAAIAAVEANSEDAFRRAREESP